jgi:predicted transposase YdaD
LLAAAQASQAEAKCQQEVRIMGQTIADALIQEGEARGEARGEAKGEAKGELRATRRHLRQLLSSQFGPLPESLVQQTESMMNLERLEEALIQAPRLKSLEELRL